MFKLAVLIGIYSYTLFVIGIFSLLRRDLIIVTTSIFLAVLLFVFRKDILQIRKLARVVLRLLIEKNALNKALWVILIVQILINLIGALGPELAFDALWYHLTIPKIFIEEGRVFFIPGGLLYYSVMPKLVDLLYIPAIVFGGEILAKLVHFSFGILTLMVLFKLAREILPKRFSIFVLVIFYSNLVVAWQSTTAYIDLARTFFEILALYLFIFCVKKQNSESFYKSAVVLGFSIATKILSATSLLTFSIISVFSKINIRKIIIFVFVAVLLPSPFFIFSFVNTGNPFFPIFTKTYPASVNINIFTEISNFVWSQDPISPIYIIVFPLIIFYYRKFTKLIKIITIYSAVSFLLWLVVPQTGGGRFVMSYLPAFSILVGAAILYASNRLKKYLIAIIISIAISTLVYRSVANFKFLPQVLGFETKHDFVTKNLNFSFGDFYDTDGYFERNITERDRVLLYGLHNLYYIDFPYIHESWAKKGDKFNYVMVQGTTGVPERFSDWRLIYKNEPTNVKLYTKGRKMWEY